MDPKLGLVLGAFLIGFAVRISKEDTKLPWTIPVRWRAPAAFMLGIIGSLIVRACTGVQSGLSWKQAVGYGALSAGLAVVGHDTGIESILNGQEIPIPGLMKKLQTVAPVQSPPAPPTA